MAPAFFIFSFAVFFGSAAFFGFCTDAFVRSHPFDTAAQTKGEKTKTHPLLLLLALGEGRVFGWKLSYPFKSLYET